MATYKWPHLERQRVISEELARRQPEIAARMRAEEQAGLAEAESCHLAMAEPGE